MIEDLKKVQGRFCHNLDDKLLEEATP